MASGIVLGLGLATYLLTVVNDFPIPGRSLRQRFCWRCVKAGEDVYFFVHCCAMVCWILAVWAAQSEVSLLMIGQLNCRHLPVLQQTPLHHSHSVSNWYTLSLSLLAGCLVAKFVPNVLPLYCEVPIWAAAGVQLVKAYARLEVSGVPLGDPVIFAVFWSIIIWVTYRTCCHHSVHVQL